MAEDRERVPRPPRPARPAVRRHRGSSRGRRARRASIGRATALVEIGLPAIIRPAFTLGGTGGGIVETEDAYWERVRAGLRASPIKQVMVERCLVGWQEIEYEVMRDADDTCIAVCSMENVDPLGVHTGDSIVVAPVQTLTDQVHQRLRSAALAIIRGARRRGRLQRPVRALARLHRVRRHRGEPARLTLVRAGLEGDRLPDRPGRGADRGRADAGRDPERGHRHDRRGVRARARLRRRQAAAVPVRQVPDRRPPRSGRR